MAEDSESSWSNIMSEDTDTELAREAIIVDLPFELNQTNCGGL
jgi:hypothetical protein